MVLTHSQWEIFCNSLNHPTKETMDARDKFFEECNKLAVTQTDYGVIIEYDDLNEEEILACLNKHIKERFRR